MRRISHQLCAIHFITIQGSVTMLPEMCMIMCRRHEDMD